MNEQATELDVADDERLALPVSDEVLEEAAGNGLQAMRSFMFVTCSGGGC